MTFAWPQHPAYFTHYAQTSPAPHHPVSQPMIGTTQHFFPLNTSSASLSITSPTTSPQCHPTCRLFHSCTTTLILQPTLDSCIFTACASTYKQIRGAGIGSQLSLALCNVATALIEHIWQEVHQTFLQQPHLAFSPPATFTINQFILTNELCATHIALLPQLLPPPFTNTP